MEEQFATIINKIDQFERLYKGEIHTNSLSLYNSLNSEIEKLDSFEIKNDLMEKLSSIFTNRINGKGVIRPNSGEARQIISEFEQLKNKVNTYNSVKEENAELQQVVSNNTNNTDLNSYYTDSTLESADGTISDDGVINPEPIENTKENEVKTMNEEITDPIVNKHEKINRVEEVNKLIEGLEKEYNDLENAPLQSKEVMDAETYLRHKTNELERTEQEHQTMISNGDFNTMDHVESIRAERAYKDAVEEAKNQIKEAEDALRTAVANNKNIVEVKRERDLALNDIDTKFRQTIFAKTRELEIEQKKIEIQLSTLSLQMNTFEYKYDENHIPLNGADFKSINDKYSDLVRELADIKNALEILNQTKLALDKKANDKVAGINEILNDNNKIVSQDPDNNQSTDDSNNDNDNSTDNSNNNDDNDNSTTDDSKDDKKPSDLSEVASDLRGKISALRDKMNNNLSEEEMRKLVEEIKKYTITLFMAEQVLFKNRLMKASTVEQKLAIIESREGDVASYSDYILSTDPKTNEDLLMNDTFIKLKKEFQDQINFLYNNDKEKGEYCWSNFANVKTSSDFVNSNIFANEGLRSDFSKYLSDLLDIINNPTEELVTEWKNNLTDFTSKNGIDPASINPYLNAVAKVKNPNIGIDNDFNITGLDLKKEKDPTKGDDEEKKNPGEDDNNKKPEDDDNNIKPGDDDDKTDDKEKDPEDDKLPPRKPRRKVTKVSKVKEWFKKHPKLKYVALGLGLLLVSQIGLGGLMMVNSTLFNVLGYKSVEAAPLIGKALHGINLGLSKVVGLGAFKFTEAGSYVLAGKAGALPLYAKAGAYLTTAALALGTIGKKVANKIKGKNQEQEIEEEEIEEEKETTTEKPKGQPKPDNQSETQRQIEEMQQQMAKMQQVLNQQTQIINNSLKALIAQGYTEDEAVEIMQNGGIQNEKTETTGKTK